MILRKLKELIVDFSYKKGGRENLQVFLNDYDQILYDKILAKETNHPESKKYVSNYMKEMKLFGV